ncbi:MAG: hypothetical protein IPO48_08790 [Saprospiraceae bacterium]|nr:hypothetical protein [Saprospiraceae bacterium]
MGKPQWVHLDGIMSSMISHEYSRLPIANIKLNTEISLGTEFEDKSRDAISLGYLSGIRIMPPKSIF